MKPKKVIIVLYSLRIGGAERQALLLAKYLHNTDGISVLVISLTGDGDGAELLEKWAIPQQHLNLDLWHNNALLRKNKKVLRSAIKAAKGDIILSYTYWANILSGLAFKRSGASLFVWGQRDEGLNMRQLPAESKALSQANLIVSNSEGGKAFLVDNYEVSEQNIKVIPNGIELMEPVRNKSAWRKELGIPADAKVATMIANIHFYKDHPTLIKAWVRVAKHFGDSTPYLVLAGHITFPERKEELEAIAKEAGILERIKIVGHIDDISGLIKACDFSVFSSPAEGLPNGVLEPMAGGLPVVMTDIPGTRACVGSDYPLLCQPENSDLMAEKIIQLLEDAELFERVATSNRARVEQLFSGQKLLDAYLKMFEQ